MTLVYYCVSIFLFLLLQDFIPKKIQPPLFTLLEFFFFATLIFQQLKLRRQKTLIVVLSACFFIFHIIYFFYPHRRKFDSIPIGIETILIFVFIFFFLYEQLKDVKDLPIYSNYFFWISIGLFIYLGGSFFIYIMATTISHQELIKYWDFTYVVEIIKNLLFAAAVFVCSKNPNKTNSKQAIPNLDFML